MSESKTTKVQKWADEAMFEAEGHEYDQTLGVEPKVHLLWMTPDPLGAVAAMTKMYKGEVVRDLETITDEERRSAFADVQKTHLKAPLEAVKLHFMLDGVDRAFTHQLVRQRTAAYAQESLRFAVVEDLPHVTTLPPSLRGTPEPLSEGWDHENPRHRQRAVWDTTMEDISAAYEKLVAQGMPQEEARGLLPHATATRVNYVTDLRNLSDHAGNRLCTQAQFHWRQVFLGIMFAIRDYGVSTQVHSKNTWQFDTISASEIFRPVCFQQGGCVFDASFDRKCSIRERVEALSRTGVPSYRWSDPGVEGETREGVPVPCTIKPAEWLLDDGAAR